MPLIVVLIISVIAPIILEMQIKNPQEIADKNTDSTETSEEILPAVVTAGSSITIEEDAIYLIKLHGGSGASKTINVGKEDEEYVYGDNGSLTTGYIKLSRGDVLTTKSHGGGGAYVDDAGTAGKYSTKGGTGLSVYLGTTERLGYVSGGPGANYVGDRGYCTACASDEGTTRWIHGTIVDFENKVNKNSTPSSGTRKTWYTLSETKDTQCSKKDKLGTWKEQEAYYTGGRRR